MHGITQIAIIVLSLGFNLYVVHGLRKEKIDYLYALIWIAAGLGMLALSVFPSLVDLLASAMGIGVSLNLLFFLAILFLLAVAFRFSISLSNLKRRIYTLTQHVAILEKCLEDEREKESGG
jgi:hypothetical protein